jgi:hypothetical protein
VDAAWDYYLRNWRPGKPHPERWSVNHGAACEALAYAARNALSETAQ